MIEVSSISPVKQREGFSIDQGKVISTFTLDALLECQFKWKTIFFKEDNSVNRISELENYAMQAIKSATKKDTNGLFHSLHNIISITPTITPLVLAEKAHSGFLSTLRIKYMLRI